MKNEKLTKRFCIEKLIAYDHEKKLETWRRTKWCHERDDLLNMLLADDHRIFDTHLNKEVRRNVDLDSWK